VLSFHRSDALSVANLITGTGSLTQAGAGTTTLTAANTYSGGTTVSSGTLMANNSTGSATGTGLVTVNSGAKLGGTGKVGPVSVSGTLLGGNGTTGTTLTVGNLTMNSGSIIQLALGTSLTHSTLALTGTYSFQTTQQFNFIELSGVTTGTYQNIITGTPTNPGTSLWTITNPGWSGTFSWDGNNIDLNLTAVPEPGTWAAASLALVALLVHQRRRLRRVFAPVTSDG
jgi:autotransporter-associated beta strand protein